MSKYCPVLKRDVVYLDCLDCDDKECRNTKSEDDKKSENQKENE